VKTLFLIYHDTLEPEISALVQRDMVIPRYTRIDDVVGARIAERERETGYTTERRSRLMVLVAEDSVIDKLVRNLRALRRRHGHGLRGFVVPTENVI